LGLLLSVSIIGLPGTRRLRCHLRFLAWRLARIGGRPGSLLEGMELREARCLCAPCDSLAQIQPAADALLSVCEPGCRSPGISCSQFSQACVAEPFARSVGYRIRARRLLHVARFQLYACLDRWLPLALGK